MRSTFIDYFLYTLEIEVKIGRYVHVCLKQMSIQKRKWTEMYPLYEYYLGMLSTQLFGNRSGCLEHQTVRIEYP